ncbi:hypothetical protein [Aureimonas frigidaquae]|uniref:hypothetical protein n=1 Tax=Aureimonas frigidaquae TaxID=424757 RepID=UPI000AF75567|nr:hypothetical protein [Aureimonas frigidaquae]
MGKRGSTIGRGMAVALVAFIPAGCTQSAMPQPFDAASALQTYDYSRLTPFPRKDKKPQLGTPYQPGEGDVAAILAKVGSNWSDPQSARIVRLQARSRPSGAVELCGLAQSKNQTGTDARMVLFGGYLTHAPDGSAYYSELQADNMFDRAQFCRSRGLT